MGSGTRPKKQGSKSSNITEKHRIQKGLRESEKRDPAQYAAGRRAELMYRAFLDFLPDPVYVFNLDGTVYYLNPAFEKVFGWTLAELKGKRIPFIPESLKEETRLGARQLMEKKIVHGVETKRFTKDGRLLDILLDGAIFYEAEDEPAGQVLILRDVTHAKLAERTNNALFRIAKALPRYRGLEELLEFIIKQVKELLGVKGAMVILLDDERKEFFFRVAAFDDTETGRRFREVRFPVDKGVAGHVYRTGKPFIVPDTAKSPYYFKAVDEQAGYDTKNMLDVPLRVKDRFIGVLCAVNKTEAGFDQADVFVLSTVASLVALPIENARINDELNASYEEVQSLNRAKENVIHHLSHELKTPLAVLSASLGLVRKKFSPSPDADLEPILARAERNLKRILDMQYQIEDILREKDYRSYHLLNHLVDACADELAVWASEEAGSTKIADAVRRRVEVLFGPKDSPVRKIRLDRFAKEKSDRLRPRFDHRHCRLTLNLEKTRAVAIPSDVLDKIVEGLIRNAVENTPDSGRIEISATDGSTGPALRITDTGVGITAENQRFLFENYFTAYDTMQYRSKNPYDFNAGGKGFDLLRMKIFSERYGFDIQLASERCRHIPGNSDLCPGSIEKCRHCQHIEDCYASGGTTVTVRFPPADKNEEKDDSIQMKPNKAAFQTRHPIAGENRSSMEDSFFREVQIEFLIHELKGPMSVVETGLRMLLEKRDRYGPLSSRQEKTLQRTLRNAGKVRQMLSHLLEIGRSQAGFFLCSRFHPTEAVFDALREAIEQAPDRHPNHVLEMDRFPETLSRFGIHLDISPEASALEMDQDELKFRQIFGNLVKNALHHRKKRIDIAITCCENNIQIDVGDDGPGIQPEHHGLVFQRYAQVNTCALPADRQGHGLGLAGAFILARCLGGTIELKSETGRGAKFRLILPVRFQENR